MSEPTPSSVFWSQLIKNGLLCEFALPYTNPVPYKIILLTFEKSVDEIFIEVAPVLLIDLIKVLKAVSEYNLITIQLVNLINVS